MLHREILSLIDRGIPIGHLEKRRRARVNNHFESEFKLKSRYDKGWKSKLQNIFANTENKTKGSTLLTRLAFLRSTWFWYHFCHTWFSCQNQVLIICMPMINCSTHMAQRVPDNQMSWIQYNYYINNVIKDYDDSQRNRIVEDFITPQEWQPGQHVA
jgi:hypothetical protein